MVLLSKAGQQANIENYAKTLHLRVCRSLGKNIGYFWNDPILFKSVKM
jgi:hypothetical protein